jgi:protein involved in polysaccharide export with SLBB domain
MPILQAAFETEADDDMPANATYPREGDWEYTDTDYLIGPRDILDISILDLYSEGLETVLRRQVTESGFIDLPLISEPIRAEDKTQEQLTKEIANKYSPDILRNPNVAVTIEARRRGTFSALGGVARPGTYEIVTKGMRLLEALALPGGRTTTNIKYIYVIRPNPAIKNVTTRPATAGKPAPENEGELPALPGYEQTTSSGAATSAASTPVRQDLRDLEKALPQPSSATSGQAPVTPSIMPHFTQVSSGAPGAGATTSVVSGEGSTQPLPPANGNKISNWVYSTSDGKWVLIERDATPLPTQTAAAPLVRPATGSMPQAPTTNPVPDKYGWAQVTKSDQARVIAINITRLEQGDPRMNIVIRDDDVIQVPVLEIGEFYVMGNVQRPGVYSLTGRKITLKMAMAAAGNFDPLAYPENSLLIRRVGENQEQIMAVNLEAIMQGRQPDIFLKTNDILAVGTSISAPFLAVLKNAFRLTYGFGFIYDRNFSDPVITGEEPRSDRFTHL